jgi:hypothetical protein
VPHRRSCGNRECSKRWPPEAGLSPEARFETSWRFKFPYSETLLRCNLAAGIVVKAVNIAGEDTVRAAIAEALAPYRDAHGGYRLDNEWHYLIARAR